MRRPGLASSSPTVSARVFGKPPGTATGRPAIAFHFGMTRAESGRARGRPRARRIETLDKARICAAHFRQPAAQRRFRLVHRVGGDMDVDHVVSCRLLAHLLATGPGYVTPRMRDLVRAAANSDRNLAVRRASENRGRLNRIDGMLVRRDFRDIAAGDLAEIETMRAAFRGLAAAFPDPCMDRMCARFEALAAEAAKALERSAEVFPNPRVRWCPSSRTHSSGRRDR